MAGLIECSVPTPAMDKTENIKVLLADDHPFTLQGLRSFLLTRGGIDVVGQAANGKDAIEKTLALRPSVVIMDLTMPVMNGLEATRHLRTCAPEVAVIILTAHDSHQFASQMIQAGARGYLSKNAPPAELLRGIETVHQGETFFSPDVTGAYVKDFLQNTGKKQLKGQGLTDRERQVVRLIAQGLSNKRAAQALGLSIRTVEKHRERIMHKLNLESIVDLTKYAIAQEIIELDPVDGLQTRWPGSF
jgi:DNA-binding NarL/FixJ family response regulator